MTRYLFVGPSLPDAADLLAADDITLLPPVAAGDLLRLAPRQGDVVGLVDGYFHQTRAVRHKEILTLLDAGVTVLGAASMGALRAAELDTFGMVGVGRVYDDYRQGRLTADDEVVLLHGPAEERYRPISEPLVNIRATLDLGVREGILDEATAGQLVAALARRPYRLRSHPELIQLARGAGMPDERVEALRHLCATRAVNLKRDDALLLVGALRTLGDGRADDDAKRAADQPADFTVAPTVYLHRWRLGARGIDTGDGRVPELSILRMCQLFARDYPEFYRDLVLRHLTRECADTCRVDEAGETLAGALAHARHRYVVPDDRSGEPEDLGFLDLWLTPAERASRCLADQLGIFVVRSFRVTPGVPADGQALDALRGRPVVATAAELVGAARSVNDQARQVQPDFDIHTLSTDRILSYFSERWGAEPGTLELHALDRGIDSLDVLVAAARPYYLLAKYNPSLVDLRVDPTTRP
ncbi:hypothetical protein GA0070606_0536 [Micromonospora citrea]|uniref:TfuA-like core domain-containing protein n=1 Tax=Micromonospora citrea TaxID=47855 RepID=A0A1C6TTF9_9ACTN|nr:TfuA-like protein [Micromonospora citrea]SCL44968.1 hypothetical protein GA0070606_0536 [Micromonospora citrea]